MKSKILSALSRISLVLCLAVCLSGTCFAAEATEATTDTNQENYTTNMDSEGMTKNDNTDDITDSSKASNDNTTTVEELENQEENEEVLPVSAKWYYQQLGELEKVVYDGFEENREDLIDGETVYVTLQDYDSQSFTDEFKRLIITAQRAYLADNPADKIWMDNCKLFLCVRNGSTELKVKPEGEFDTRGATEEFEEKANEFLETLSGTDYQKLIAIHDWLMSNVKYDLEGENRGNAYGAIVEGRSVCSGFAYSFKYLADKAGLNVIYVQGYYHNANTDTYGYHAWNMAEINGEWYLIDVTFDTSLQSTRLFRWHNQGDHYPDSCFTYPT